MKKLFLTILTGLLWTALYGIEAVIKARPSRPVAGENFMLELTVDSAENFTLSLPELPEGMEISRQVSSQSQNISIVNGRRTVEIKRSFSVRADRAGEYRIPPFTLDFGGEKVTTNALELTVRSAAEIPDDEKISAVLTLRPERPVYAGEVMQADIELFIPFRWNLRGISAVKPENFADGTFITVPGQSGSFYQSSDFVRRGNGYSLELQGVFQVLASGEFEPVCRIDLQLSGRSSAYDSFFAPPPTSRTITAKAAKPLKVLPRPALPQGAIDTGLTGKWQIAAKLSKTELRAGDIAELTLEFSGNVPAPGFRAPQLTIPDARVYPAERSSDRRQTRFTVKYPFVALKAGKYELPLQLAVLDPQNGKYVLTSPEIAYIVVKNPELAAVPPAPVKAPETPPDKTEKTVFSAFELRKTGKMVSLPLVNNILPWAAGFIAGGLIILGISFLPGRKTPANQKALRRIIAAVSAKGTGTLLESGSAEIAEALGLPPGTTFAEIAEYCPDKETAEFFRQLDSAAYNPAAGNTDTPEIRKKVVKFLKSLLIFAVVFLFALPVKADHAAAEKAFYEGKYAEAQEEFRKIAAGEKDHADPALFYNLGCAGYMCGNFASAYANFRRAALLAPIDRQFAEAAAMAEAKLPGAAVDHPLLRQLGIIRPDGYILLASVMFALGCIFIALRRKIPRKITVGMTVFCAVLMLAGISAAAVLQRTVYASDRAVVIAPDAEISSLPSASGGSRAKLPAGTIVRIGGENGSFVRVENRDVSGWIKKDALKRFFPYEIF